MAFFCDQGHSMSTRCNKTLSARAPSAKDGLQRTSAPNVQIISIVDLSKTQGMISVIMRRKRLGVWALLAVVLLVTIPSTSSFCTGVSLGLDKCTFGGRSDAVGCTKSQADRLPMARVRRDGVRGMMAFGKSGDLSQILRNYGLAALGTHFAG